MADKAAKSSSTRVTRPGDKRGGYSSGDTPAANLPPPTTGVKPAGGSGGSGASDSKK
jgi:hypothetical protein